MMCGTPLPTQIPVEPDFYPVGKGISVLFLFYQIANQGNLPPIWRYDANAEVGLFVFTQFVEQLHDTFCKSNVLSCSALRKPDFSRFIFLQGNNLSAKGLAFDNIFVILCIGNKFSLIECPVDEVYNFLMRTSLVQQLVQ